MWARRLLWAIVLAVPGMAGAQELDCKVIVNGDQVQTTDRSVFKDMERAFATFLNGRRWTSDNFKEHERIKCSIFINLKSESNVATGNYSGSAQIAAARPVFNTNYETVLLNFADREWEFEYIESLPLEYNDNAYISNLTSMLAFYAYVIIGSDYDSFSELGGTPHFQRALNVVNNAQGSGRPGWQALTSNRNRNSYISDIINPQNLDIRKSLYRYHRLALDTFDKNPDESRDVALNTLKSVQKTWQINPTSIFVISFFDAKATELTNVFSKANLNVKREAFDLLTLMDSKRTIYQDIMKN